MQKHQRPKDDSNKRVWVLRAGEGGDADDLFLKHCLVVLNDPGLGDLRKLAAEREAFYDRYRSTHPGESRGATAGTAGKYYRFIHEVAVGDLIVYPSLLTKLVHIGEVAGQYSFSLSPAKMYPHHRKVRWLCAIPKSSLSQEAIREMGAARTFFEVKRYAQLFQRLAQSHRETAPTA